MYNVLITHIDFKSKAELIKLLKAGTTQCVYKYTKYKIKRLVWLHELKLQQKSIFIL